MHVSGFALSRGRIRLATARRADAARVEGVGDLAIILFQAMLSRPAWADVGFRW